MGYLKEFYLRHDRLISKLFLPIALYNLIMTFIGLVKQYNIFKDTINNNLDFFRALNTMGFTPSGFFGLVSIHEVDKSLSDEEIYKIANQNFILIVKKFIISEAILDIVKVEIIKIKGFRIRFTINMVNYNLLLVDIFDFIISLFIWSIGFLSIYLLF